MGRVRISPFCDGQSTAHMFPGLLECDGGHIFRLLSVVHEEVSDSLIKTGLHIRKGMVARHHPFIYFP